MKRFLALVTALVLMGVFLPLTVSASTLVNNEAQLRAALSASGSGAVVTLTANIATLDPPPLFVERTSTLDLNGHTLTTTGSSGSGALDISSGAFTIMCSTGTGVLNVERIYVIGGLNISGGTINNTIIVSGMGAGISVWGGELNISGGVVNATGSGGSGGSGIETENGATITISGGEVNATTRNNGNGIRVVRSELNISGGEVNATGRGIANYGISVGESELNISGGVVNATSDSTGIIVLGGELNISGGSVNATDNLGNPRIFLGSGATLTNGAGVPVFLNTLTTSPVQSNSAVTSASFSGISYGVNDVFTNASGQLFFFLPATNAAHNARVRIGGSNFVADYIRNANHNNTATLNQVAGLTHADVQALVDQNPNPPSGAGILPAHVNRFNAARASASIVANPASPNTQHTNEELLNATFANAIMVLENTITRMHSAIARAEQK
jgi:hypothetical protein